MSNDTDDFKRLVKELAENYFDNASIDICPNQRDKSSKDYERLQDLREAVFNGVTKEKSPRRNILVIGAGATANSFTNIPLAKYAISNIQKNIIVSKFEIDNKEIEIDFDFFINYYKNEIKHPNKTKSSKKRDCPKCNYLNKVFRKQEHRNDKINGSLSYLESLGKNYFDEYEKLKLHSLEVTKQKQLDFETSLVILVKLFNLSSIRDLIKREYDYRNAPTLFYELVAHYFKNGFIDVIINFNFDELLDQAIENELGGSSYDYIFSDGDCKKQESGGRLRQPLYIKPHGTVSHKSSLRFTKSHYYELPTDMRRFIEEVISGPKEIHRTINLITAGFEMESLEFNEILKNKLPKGSNIFNLFYAKNDKKTNEIIKAKKRKLKQIFKTPDTDEHGELQFSKKGEILLKNQDNKPKFYFISHESFQNNKNSKVDHATLGNTFKIIYDEIRILFKPLFKPVNISKHLIISDLFGNNSVVNHLNNSTSKDYPKEYFNSHHYFKDRVIIESLMHIVTNNGLVNVSTLMKGVTGYYYSKYNEAIIDFNEKPENEKDDIESISKILERIMKITESEIKDGKGFKLLTVNYPDRDIDLLNRIKNGLKKDVFSKQFSGYIEKLNNNKKIDNILSSFKDILNSNSTVIKSSLRSTIHHTFNKYDVSDLITNTLLQDLYFYSDLKDMSSTNAIYAIADYGHQISKFIQRIVNENKIQKLSLILQYDFEDEQFINFSELRKKAISKIINKYSDVNYESVEKIFEIYFLPIRRHNHHMLLFVNEKEQSRKYNICSAVYYYKFGLSTNINPIRIKEDNNQKFLQEKFEHYREKSIKFMITRQTDNYVEPLLDNKEKKEYLQYGTDYLKSIENRTWFKKLYTSKGE